MNLEKLSHFAFVAACLFLMAVVIVRHTDRSQAPRAREVSSRGRILDHVREVPFDRHDVTVYIVVSPGCPYCTDSLAFYDRVVTAAAGSTRSVQVIFASPAPTEVTAAYLTGNGVRLRSAVVGPVLIPVDGAPTVLVIKRSGEVLAGWYGRMDRSQERALVKLVS